jgi:hypothetical protein
MVRTEYWNRDIGTRKLFTVSIVRMDKDLIWTIRPETNQYVENTKAHAQAKQAEVDAFGKNADAMTRNAYAKLTPKEKAEVDKVYREEGMGSVTEKHSMQISMIDYKPTGKTWNVQQWSCDVYEVWRNGIKISEDCMIDGNQILPGLGDAGLQLKKYMQSFYGGEISGFAKTMQQAQEKAMGAARFQLKSITYSNGKPKNITQFVEAKEENLAASLFEIPPGIAKTDNLWIKQVPATSKP